MIIREIRRPLRRRLPRNASVLTRCRRGELAEGAPEGPAPTRAFLGDLRRVDRDLEVYWHPHKRRWVLYRLLRRGSTPAGDLLMKEYDVQGPGGQYRPLGPWLIDWLRLNDKSRGGSIDPERGGRLWLQCHLRQERELEERRERRLQEHMGWIRSDIERIGGNARFSREIRARHIDWKSK